MHWIVGIDEVGRGPLFGPVLVTAVAFPKNKKLLQEKSLGKLRDSKKLSTHQREHWTAFLTSLPTLKHATAKVGVKTIDRKNISWAANKAAEKALLRLLQETEPETSSYEIYLDGGLFLGSIDPSIPWKKGWSVKTVIRGDEKIPAVAMASIIAKVKRDRLITHLATIYPGYGLERHKGYGTQKHLAAVKKKGLTPLHRLTFFKNYPKIKPIK